MLLETAAARKGMLQCLLIWADQVYTDKKIIARAGEDVELIAILDRCVCAEDALVREREKCTAALHGKLAAENREATQAISHGAMMRRHEKETLLMGRERERADAMLASSRAELMRCRFHLFSEQIHIPFPPA